jgi:hypothetical protein
MIFFSIMAGAVFISGQFNNEFMPDGVTGKNK